MIKTGWEKPLLISLAVFILAGLTWIAWMQTHPIQTQIIATATPPLISVQGQRLPYPTPSPPVVLGANRPGSKELAPQVVRWNAFPVRQPRSPVMNEAVSPPSVAPARPVDPTDPLIGYTTEQKREFFVRGLRKYWHDQDVNDHPEHYGLPALPEDARPSRTSVPFVVGAGSDLYYIRPSGEREVLTDKEIENPSSATEEHDLDILKYTCYICNRTNH